MKKSLIYLLLQYAHQKHPNSGESFTTNELFALQDEAQKYYRDKLPFDHKKETYRIAKKHGFNKKQWDEVLQASQSFFFLATDQMNACNKEIRDLFALHDHIERTAYYIKYLASLLYNATKYKKPYLQRTKIDGVFHYSLIKPTAK